CLVVNIEVTKCNNSKAHEHSVDSFLPECKTVVVVEAHPECQKKVGDQDYEVDHSMNGWS
ncbi:MAG: hypothetical protein V2I33_22755, partial [Kangiellaceae bacterium]|nr:hypothetical protein [Kangiellaceae bacterium]